MSDTRLILHVKGTHAETAELPKDMVRTAISQGDLTHSQLIWSKADHAWKQAREFPDLLPEAKVAPAPERPAAPVAPVARAAAPVARMVAAQAPVPVAARPARAQAAPTVMAASAAKAAAPAVAKSYVVKEEADHAHPMKWVCVVLGALIVLALGTNYFLVERPFAQKMGQTPYAGAPVYAHLGAFVQPNVIVIHIPVSKKVTADNLIDFLVNLAASTPSSPFSDDGYDRVALTSGWTAQYTFSGYNWMKLGDMTKESNAAREEFLLSQLSDARGDSLEQHSTLNAAAQEAARDQLWQSFVANFTAKQ